MKTAEYWIEKLQLTAHPEGGYFKETYRSAESIPAAGLPSRFTGARDFSTGIYFLLKGDEFSTFHRIKSDETWHFYTGCPLTLFVINVRGELEKHLLGSNAENGESFQITIAANQWFAAQPNDPGSYSLCGCTVAPGFDFADFEMAEKDQLQQSYPQLSDTIEKFCR